MLVPLQRAYLWMDVAMAQNYKLAEFILRTIFADATHLASIGMQVMST